MANVTGARILAGEIKEGRYLRTLTMDGLPGMTTVGTSGTDSIVTDSANSQSAYNTGHKSAVNALGVCASRATNTLLGGAGRRAAGGRVAGAGRQPSAARGGAEGVGL